MTKFERITAALGALPEARREQIAEILETLFFADLNPGQPSRNQEQAIDPRQHFAAPREPDAEIEEIVRRFSA